MSTPVIRDQVYVLIQAVYRNARSATANMESVRDTDYVAGALGHLLNCLPDTPDIRQWLQAQIPKWSCGPNGATGSDS